jgi:DNA-binding CsgD family transcriptional regulator
VNNATGVAMEDREEQDRAVYLEVKRRIEARGGLRGAFEPFQKPLDFWDREALVRREERRVELEWYGEPKRPRGRPAGPGRMTADEAAEMAVWGKGLLWIAAHRLCLDPDRVVEYGKSKLTVRILRRPRGYAVMVARNHIRDGFRAIRRAQVTGSITARAREAWEAMSWDDALPIFGGGAAPKRALDIMSHEALTEANWLLTWEDRRIVDWSVLGYTQKWIADRIGCKQPKVSKAFRRIIRTLEEAEHPELHEVARQMRLRGRETRREAMREGDPGWTVYSAAVPGNQPRTHRRVAIA